MIGRVMNTELGYQIVPLCKFSGWNAIVAFRALINSHLIHIHYITVVGKYNPHLMSLHNRNLRAPPFSAILGRKSPTLLQVDGMRTEKTVQVAFLLGQGQYFIPLGHHCCHRTHIFTLHARQNYKK